VYGAKARVAAALKQDCRLRSGQRIIVDGMTFVPLVFRSAPPTTIQLAAVHEDAFMSYLDPPRFSFSGRFVATPSTINNSTPNYDPDAVYNTNPPSGTNVNSVSWNPVGWAFFSMTTATVNGACAQLGSPITSGDPIIGATLVSVATSSSAPPPPQQGRLVDLDPDQQNVSMIVGTQLQLSINGTVVLTGTMAPATIIDLWGRVQSGSAQGINSAGAMYQSVLQNVSWPGLSAVSSPLLNALNAVSPDTLSIKFNLDAYNGIPQSADFNSGRIVGTIGPYGEIAAVPEPMHVLAQRRMWGGAASVNPKLQTALNPAPFQTKANSSYLTIDLGNSMPTASTPDGLAGSFLDLGPVCPVIDTEVLDPLFSTGAEFGANYTSFAGIYDIDLAGVSAANVVCALQIGPSSTPAASMTAAQASAAKRGAPVTLKATAPAASDAMIALAENTGGQFASFDFNALRLANGAPAWSDAALTGTEITSTAEVPFYATVFGEPAANETFNVQTAFAANGSAPTPAFVGNAPASSITPSPTSVTPPSSGPTPNIASITTDANGCGTFSITANGLDQSDLDTATDNWREGLPSQIYLYTHDWNMNTLAGPPQPGGQPLTCLLFVSTQGPAQPTWTNDVQPIFAQYAKIYPGMKQVLDLSDYDTVVANLETFNTVMNVPMSDPRHMPVTRDLAPAQLAMINAWFANPLK